MKKTLLLVLVAISILATGCISIIEELSLNKDGSGTFSYTIDMAALMELGVLNQARAMSEEGGEQEAIEVDTVINAYASLDEKGQLTDMEKPDFWKKVKIVSKISESEKIGTISFILDFKQISDIDYFLNNIGKLFENDEMTGMLGSMNLLGNTGSPYSLKGRSLSRAKQQANGEITEAMKEEGGEMMKMMLTGAKYITIYNLPGKASKVSNTTAEISNEGKTVKLEVDLLEYLEGKADLATAIKYKK